MAIGEPGVRGELEQIIKAYEAWTSTYVLMEFRRTAVHAFEVVRRLAIEAPDDEPILLWILRRIERGYSGQGRRLTPRESTRSRKAVHMVWELLGRMAATRPVVVQILDDTIRLVQDMSWVGIARMVDETDCDLIRPDRPQGRRWPLTCNAQQAQCCQSLFLDRHRSKLLAILAECRADTEFDDTRMLDVLGAALKAAPLIATGQRRCWYLADVIMALEALPAGTLLSSNGRHFGPICRALGLTLKTYSP